MAKAPSPKLASGDTAYLYRAAIGPRAQDYYLRHFARFDGEGKAGSSWNWAAYWSTFNWLVYRRMWGWALAYVGALLGLALLVFGVGKLVFNYSDTSAVLLSLFLLAAAFVLPGLYANAWFYTHCNEKISAALRSSPEVKDAASVLASQAPDNRRLLLLGLGNAALLALVLTTVNWLQTSESALPQMAAHEERPLAGGQSGQVRALAPAPAEPTVTASAPDAVPAPFPLPWRRPPLPRDTPAGPGRKQLRGPAPVRPAANGKPAMVNASDRSVPPAKPAPAARPLRPAWRQLRRHRRHRRPRHALRPAPRSGRYVWVIQVGAYAQGSECAEGPGRSAGAGPGAGAESSRAPRAS